MGAWEKFALCECGWYRYCSFGDLFHLHVEVCPRCGADKNDSMKIVTGRNRGFFTERLEIKEPQCNCAVCKEGRKCS